MRALPLALVASLALAGAALACGGSVPMGALRLPYDPAIWRAEVVGPDHWRLIPLDEREGSTVEATTGDTACDEAAMAALVARGYASDVRAARSTNRHGLTVVSAEGYTGCRNLTAGPVAACVRDKGRTWRFVTADRGCSLTRYGKADPLHLLEELQRDDGRPPYR